MNGSTSKFESETGNRGFKVIVVGPSWYGNWVEFFFDGLKSVGADADVIYTNALFGSSLGYGSESVMSVFEKVKRMIFKISPGLFEFLKGVRRKMSERDLLKRIKTSGGKKPTVVVFVWTPPSVKLLKKLRGEKGLKLVYWIGEPLSRDAKWRKTLSYFDHLFLIDSPEWSGGLDEDSTTKSSLLPLASNANFKKPELTEEDKKRYGYEVAFVGLYKPERAKILEPIRNFDFRVYGHGWEGAEKEFPWLKGHLGGPVSVEEFGKIFSASKVSIGSLGISFTENLPTLTQRVFDVALCGGFQVSQWNPLTEEVMGESVPLFKSSE